ncbi:uncharacterized protein LOC143021264 [Oratosquilla oratoria]|uniref:uncharacterized protein LOC143021264 n=1 Tax=Oratosquilla oratoria TaxID=337810 RepID=UPI003F770B8E
MSPKKTSKATSMQKVKRKRKFAVEEVSEGQRKNGDDPEEQPAEQDEEKPAEQDEEKPAEQDEEKPAEQDEEKPAEQDEEKPAEQDEEKPAEQDEELVEQTDLEEETDDEGEESVEMAQSKVPELPPHVEQELAEFYAQNPLFYDKSRHDFKNSKKKERLLEEKAASMNLSVAVLKLSYRSQRTIVGKVMKRKSGQASKSLTARQKWVMTNLSFLKKHIVHQPISSQLGQTPLEEGDEAADGKMVSHAFTSQQSHAKSKHLRKDADPALMAHLQKSGRTEGVSPQVHVALSQDQDEQRAWVEWMHQALRHLPRHLWREFTKESFIMVTKYQERAEVELTLPQLPEPMQQQPIQPASTPMLTQMLPSLSSVPTHWTQDYIQMKKEMW